MISMSAIWDRTAAFTRAEASLLVPVALATLGTSNVVIDLANARGPGPADWGQTILMLGAALVAIVGQLTIVAMVLTPNVSVGDALRAGGSRMLTMIGTGAIVGLAVLCAMFPLVAGLIAGGYDIGATPPQLPGWAALYMLIAGGAIFYGGARLIVAANLIVDRNAGPVQALTGSWRLTRGHAWKIMAIILVWLAISLVLTLAAQTVFGSVFTLIGKASGSEFTGRVLTAIVTGVVAAILSLISTVFVTFLYVDLASEGSSSGT